MFWKDILHICLSWLVAVEHGKIGENTVNSGIFFSMVLERLYGQKGVHCHVLAGKHCQNTVKNNVWEGYLAYMFELASGRGT